MQTACKEERRGAVRFTENKSPNERSKLKRPIRGGGEQAAGREEKAWDGLRKEERQSVPCGAWRGAGSSAMQKGNDPLILL